MKKKKTRFSALVGKRVIWRRWNLRTFQKGKWEYTTEDIDVTLLAVTKGYAMIRRPHCMPLVVSLKDLI